MLQKIPQAVERTQGRAFVLFTSYSTMNPTPRKHVISTAPTPCGAKTRAGQPCKRLDTARNGKCRLHGGKSTGPTTEAGKAQSRINGRLGGRKPKGQVLSGSQPPQPATLSKTLPVPALGNRTEMLGNLPKTSPVRAVEDRSERLGLSHTPG